MHAIRSFLLKPMNTPQNQNHNKVESKSTFVVRGVMYACVTVVVLMDLYAQVSLWAKPSYWTYFGLATLVAITEFILWHDKRHPGLW